MVWFSFAVVSDGVIFSDTNPGTSLISGLVIYASLCRVELDIL